MDIIFIQQYFKEYFQGVPNNFRQCTLIHILLTEEKETE